MHDLKTLHQRNRGLGRLKANTEPEKAPHTRNMNEDSKRGKNNITVTEARQPGQEKQLPEPTYLPGNKTP